MISNKSGISCMD